MAAEEWLLYSQAPACTTYRQASPSTQFTEATEFSFFSTAAQQSFQASKSGLYALCHPHIIGISPISGGHSENNLHYFTLQNEPCDSTLDTETEAKLRSGQPWTMEEVTSILKQLTDALQCAAENGFHCSDFRWENIAWIEGAAKVRRLHTKDGVWFNELSPAFLSPEMRAEYVKWSHGDQPSPVDLERAAVYSLGLLGLSLLCPDLGERVVPPSDLQKYCEKPEVPMRLRFVLLRMVRIQPESRVSIAELKQLLSSDSEIDLAGLLTDLNSSVRADGHSLTSDLLSLLLTQSISVQVDYPCSLCSAILRIYPNPTSCFAPCIKHIMCPEHEGGKCVLCPLRKLKIVRKKESEAVPGTEQAGLQCAVCHKEFVLERNSWRLEFLGSLLYTKSKTVCSLACLQPPTTPITPEIPDTRIPEVDSPPQRSAHMSSVKAQILSLINIYNSKNREMENFAAHLDSESLQELLDTDSHGDQRNGILRFNGNLDCHFCRKPLQTFFIVRWVVCGSIPRCICSMDCVRSSPPVCRACRVEVMPESVASALGLEEEVCRGCGSRDGQRQDCGHFYCSRCAAGKQQCEQCVKVEYELRMQVARQLRERGMAFAPQF